MKKGIYLGAYRALHPGYDIVYQDINGKRDMGGDMLDVNLSPYDYIICTPPCNYWSKSNYRRDNSDYSLKTKHLLPIMLRRLCKQDKPFIVENVRNAPAFAKLGLFDLPCFVFFIGRHTYWTNILLFTDIQQEAEIIVLKKRSEREGGNNVHEVIDLFLNFVQSL